MMSEGGVEATSHGWSAAELRRVGYRVADLLAAYLSELPERPVFRVVPPAEVERWGTEAAPRAGSPVDELLEEWTARVAPYPFGNGHPRFFAWVNSPPAVVGVFAEALAAAMNPSVAGGNHAAVYVERQVVRWFTELLALPPGSMGLLVSGTSAAAITALAVARHVATRKRGWDVRATGVQGLPARLVVYKTAEGHGCNQKAVELLGLGSDSLRVVPTDAALRLSVPALESALRRDLEAGHVPVAVVASAGTVNTGAVDPLDELADLCAAHGVWLHVDAAYGGPAILSGRYRAALGALARADSVALDPHKWLYVPVDAGLVLLRDGAAMRDAFSLVPPYLRTDGDPAGVQGPPWLSEFGMEQTRPFRALKVWFALKQLGLEGYRAAVEHDMALAAHLAEAVRAAPDLELWEPVGMSIVCFRCRPAALGGEGAAEDDLTRNVLEEIQLGGEAFLSGTTLNGRFWLRACIVNPLARPADVERVVVLTRQMMARRLEARPPAP